LVIAEAFAARAVASGLQPECVCDPFCGDGRLVAAWLKRAAVDRTALERLAEVRLWDYDSQALQIAQEAIGALLQEFGLAGKVRLVAASGDTFRRVAMEPASVDLLLTNPPWELLKPDARDAVEAPSEYRQSLRVYADWLDREFPGCKSASGKAVTGYGVNLARAGAIASARLLRPGAAMYIVLPSSIFADQASAPFRSSLFQRLDVGRIEYFPAEAKLFDSVDQAFVTLSARSGGPTRSFHLARFDAECSQVESREHLLRAGLGDPLALAVAGDAEDVVRAVAGRHASLSMLEMDLRVGLWLGRELDETRLAEAFGPAECGIPFLKGRHVFPFQIKRDSIDYIDPARRQIPSTVRERRLAWRDVSRPSQRRRMHVALVPPGNVTGNSLGVAYLRNGDAEALSALLAIMNSLVFELQVRTKLATTHVSQGVLRQCAVPLKWLLDSPERNDLLRVLGRRLDSEAELPDLEIAVARAYGLDRDAFDCVLSAFPKLTAEEREALLCKDLW
jgi:Alw26I/Eco31I/Esp3I family type II restriction m6 adenine DNA methyltransferase